MGVTGPSCIPPNSTQNYAMQGPTTGFSYSVTGGTLSTGGTGGSSTGSIKNITVNWGTSGGSISMTSPSFNTTYTVSIPSTFVGGTISSGGSQAIAYTVVPASINCPAATGGYCAPTRPGTATYSYQWQQSADNSTFTNISGATGLNLSFTNPLSQTMYYRRFVTQDQSGLTTYSNTAVVTVYQAVSAGAITPHSQLINYGTTPSTMSLSSTSGGSGTYTYLWYYSLDNSTWNSIPSATGSSYSPGSLTATTYYKVAVSSAGMTDYATITVTVLPQVVAGTPVNSSQQINYNGTAAVLSVSGTGGGDGTYTYQWLSSSTLSGFYTPFGPTGSTYTPVSLTATTYYEVVVTSHGSSVNSAPFTVNVYPRLVSGVISPASSWINYNTVPGLTLTVAAATGGNGSYAYQWLYSTSATGPWTALGVTATSCTPGGALTSTTYYRVAVNSNGAVDTSASAAINVHIIPGTIAGPSTAIKYNGSTTINNSTLPAGGGCNGAFTYRWFKSNDGVSYTVVAGATGTSLTDNNLGNDTWYKREAVCSGDTAVSSAVRVSVNAALVAGTITPAIGTVVSGGNPGVLTSNGASGGSCNGAYVYLWQQSGDGTNFSTASGSNNQQFYSPGAISATTFYRVRVACSGDTVYSDAAVVNVAAYGASADVSYIRSKIITKPGVTDMATVNSLNDIYDIKIKTNYFDGLVRPLQEVDRKASPLGKDLVTAKTYDVFGRPLGNYLPYADTSTDGSYKPVFLSNQTAFNAAIFPGEQYYYAQNVFESSTIDRPVISYSPGMNWIGKGKGKVQQYQLNSDGDSVRIWNINLSPGSLALNSGMYGSATIYKGVNIDEAGHTIIQYFDMDGHMLLKRVQLWDQPSFGPSGWLSTYYVYDNSENLRLVIQPKAVDWLAGHNWSFSGTGADTVLSELCFRYEYDNRNRVYSRKLPGTGNTWMVYDVRDRLVMSQDSNLSTKGKWLVNEYDNLNRLVRTGLLSDTHNQAYHQNLANGSSSYPSTDTAYEILSKKFYDDYSWVGAGTGGIGSSLAAPNAADIVTSYNTSPQYAQPLTAYTNTHGLLTGEMSKVLDSTVNLYSVNFYDEHGLLIQRQAVNITGGIDTTTTQFDFAGKTLRSAFYHRKNGNTAQNHTLVTKLNYDGVGRVKTIYKNIDRTGDQLIDSIQMNELSQVRVKYLGNMVDSVVYSYNIRGWMTGINKKYVAGGTGNYFGQELAFDTITSVTGANYSSPQYNGNVAGYTWKSAGDTVKRRYNFGYDNLNRLTAANFLQDAGGGWNNSSKDDYTVRNLRYDVNGSITSMSQRGWKLNGSDVIDSLSYQYQSNSNKLSQVSDAKNDSLSRLGDFHYTGVKTGPDYGYDFNGNMISDQNRGIDVITYNHLNQPVKVHIKGKGTITYTYEAAGVKLKKLVMDSVSRRATTTLYLSGLVYQQNDTITSPTSGVDTLQYLRHEEGRARWAYHSYLKVPAAYKWEYDFSEKDYLGNVRVLLTQQRDTAQYLASMEGAYRAKENQLFYNIPQTSYSKVLAGFPVDTTTNPNDSVAMLNGNAGRTMGPAIILKVMAGDVIDVGVKSYYTTLSGSSNNSSLTDALNSLANGLAGVTNGSKGALADLSNPAGPVFAALSSFITSKDTLVPSKPKAYLNYMFLDNQFKLDSAGSGAIPVSKYAAGTLGLLARSGIITAKSGYLYVYVSNETANWPVYFDNLSIIVRSGPLLEETHYYPYGLTMAGISDKALKSRYTENKIRYNGKELQSGEFSDGSGLEMYDFDARQLDPQLGVWHSADPLADKSRRWSQYSYAYGNPLRFIDVDGMENFGIHRAGYSLNKNDYFSADARVDKQTEDFLKGKSPDDGDDQEDGNEDSKQKGSDASAQNASPQDIIYTSHGKEVFRQKNAKVKLTIEVGDDYFFDHGKFVYLSGFEVIKGDRKVAGNNTEEEGGEEKEEKTLEKVVISTQLAVDVNATTWTTIGKLAKGAKEVVEIADKGTLVGIAIGVADAANNLAHGRGTWRDGVTLGVAFFTGVSMATGVGEVAMGVVGLGWDIYNAYKLMHEK